MKTYRTFVKSSLRYAAAALLTLALANNVTAAETKTGKGGAADLLSKPIRTTEDLQAVQAGDTVVMACPKCKTVHVTRVTKELKGQVSQSLASEKHLCPGCENQFEVKGHGKAKTETVVHKCSSCGSKNAFCCVVKGEGPTKGMEHAK